MKRFTKVHWLMVALFVSVLFVHVESRAELFTIYVPPGVGSPGCEETFAGCFLPKDLTINVGDTVTWVNADPNGNFSSHSAITVTSGTLSDGLSGIFDSGLLLRGNMFTHHFNESGDIPYFDLVHPWVTGIVRVTPVPEPTTLLTALGLGSLLLFRRRTA